MSNVLGKRVRLRLLDPDAGYGSRMRSEDWPTLRGTIVYCLPGLHGKKWYLLELDGDFLSYFRPNRIDSQLFDMVRGRTVKHLLVAPSPNTPTVDVPVDFIGERLSIRAPASVLVLIGKPPEQLPTRIEMGDVPRVFPGICSGELAISEHQDEQSLGSTLEA
jgi:hypothetical protein